VAWPAWPEREVPFPAKAVFGTAPVLATPAPLRTVPEVISLLAAAETPAPAAEADVVGPLAPLAVPDAMVPVTAVPALASTAVVTVAPGETMLSVAAPGERSTDPGEVL